MINPRRTLAFALFLASAAPLGAFDAPADPSSPRPGGDLVKELADPNFRVREKAELELLRRGPAALADIKRGSDDDNLEIRRRSRRLLEQIPVTDDDLLVAAFLLGKEDPKAALPGWSAIRGAIGDDANGRYVYAVLFKSDRALLTSLESDRKAFDSQIDSRIQKTVSRTTGNRKPTEATGEEFTSLLVAVNLAPPLSQNSSQQWIGLLSQPYYQSMIGWSSANRRLVERWLEQKSDDAAVAQQVANVAIALGCTDLIERKFRPTAARLIDAAASNPSDFQQLYRALNMARQLGMTELVDHKLKPAVLKAIEAALREPVDLNRLNQLTGAAQTLGGMEAELKSAIRPALAELVKKQAANVGDMTRFYAVVNLARISQSQDLIDEFLRPAYRATLLRLTAQAKDFMPLNQAFYQAQSLGMQEEIESILKPAVEALIGSVIAQKKDARQLQLAFGSAQMFQLNDSLPPIARQLIDDVVKNPADVARTAVALQFARAANLPDINDVIEKQFKPATRAGLATFKETQNPQVAAQQVLSLVDQLQLKEGVPIALKLAQNKALPNYLRSQAIGVVAKYADREAIPLLEPLLAETADVGSGSMNGVAIRTQLGDVALAAVIQLSGQKLSDYDFPWARFGGVNQQIFQSPTSYGFETDAGRRAMQKKWRDSVAAPAK